MIIWVKSLEAKTTQNGKRYDRAEYTTDGGETDFLNLFKPPQRNMFKKALDENLAIDANIIINENGYYDPTDCKLVADEIATNEEAPVPQQLSNAPQPVPQKKESGQETGMWWKELGMWLRLYTEKGELTPEQELWRKAYFTQMLSVLPIKQEKN